MTPLLTLILLIVSFPRYHHIFRLLCVGFSYYPPQLQKGANDARSDDVRRIKEEVANWINQTFSPTTPLCLKQRDGRGFQNDITGRLLCPIEHSWDDDEYVIPIDACCVDKLFGSVRRKIRNAELDISEDYFLACLYPRGLGNPDDVERGFLRSGLLIKVCKFSIYYLPTSIPNIRPFVLFSHHHHPQKHSMSENPKKGQVGRSRNQRLRRRQRRLMLRLCFIWKGESHREQLRTLQPWYVLPYQI
jgi:hypothetical protein